MLRSFEAEGRTLASYSKRVAFLLSLLEQVLLWSILIYYHRNQMHTFHAWPILALKVKEIQLHFQLLVSLVSLS